LTQAVFCSLLGTVISKTTYFKELLSYNLSLVITVTNHSSELLVNCLTEVYSENDR